MLIRPRRHTSTTLTWAAAILTILTTLSAAPAEAGGHPTSVHPSLRQHLAAYYDFDHPVRGNPSKERDLGFSRTDIDLVNGGARMRTKDGAHRGSRTSLQVRQVSPQTKGNDDWKAGVHGPSGVPTLNAFNAVKGMTVMGWFKMTGPNPSPNSNTAAPDDHYGAVGLAGVLSGDSDGHAVRGLLEIIEVNGELRLVALGRRVDGASSQTFAASQDWRTLLPDGKWVHLAATFDFDTGAMALYRDGKRLDGFYAVPGDPWDLSGPGPHRSSPTDPRGIKIGGSFPQNTLERNPCDCRMDSLMFLNTALDRKRIQAQYRLTAGR